MSSRHVTIWYNTEEQKPNEVMGEEMNLKPQDTLQVSDVGITVMGIHDGTCLVRLMVKRSNTGALFKKLKDLFFSRSHNNFGSSGRMAVHCP